MFFSFDVTDIDNMCEHNKKEAAAVGRKDLVRVGILRLEIATYFPYMFKLIIIHILDI